MKLQKLFTACLMISIMALLFSCNEDGPAITPTTPEANGLGENFLGMSSIMDRLAASGFDSPIGALFGESGGARARTSHSPLAAMRAKRNMTSSRHALGARTDSDSTDIDIPGCLTETWEEDGAGNYTYTLDFGDGCDYYGEFLKGKLVETGSYTENTFVSTTTFTNFGGEDWTINGTKSYDGSWTETFSEDDTEVESFSAQYSFDEDISAEFIEWGYEEDEDSTGVGEMLITVNYVADGSESVDDFGFTINSNNENIEVSTGETLTSSVDTPLYFDFGCEENDVFVFVSGVESGTWSYGDESGSYSIDYGDGSCDNIVTYTENGVSEEVDLGEEWDEWEEECGDDHDEDDEGEDGEG